MRSDLSPVPRHIAIIMDGNGRWARKKGLPRIKGHDAAERAIHESVELCGELGVEYLTLYAFSTENWSRPRAEVAFIMKLLSRFIKRNLEELHRKKVKLITTGRLADIPKGPRNDLEEAMAKTASNEGLTLVLALSYGGRAELRDAFVRIAGMVQRGELTPEEITEEKIAGFLYNPDVPDPELIIRTSGEQRLSNFLMWQSAYSEFIFSPVLWPDFDSAELQRSIDLFRSRNRRFGGVEYK